jgi:hypothetical protein
MHTECATHELRRVQWREEVSLIFLGCCNRPRPARRDAAPQFLSFSALVRQLFERYSTPPGKLASLKHAAHMEDPVPAISNSCTHDCAECTPVFCVLCAARLDGAPAGEVCGASPGAAYPQQRRVALSRSMLRRNARSLATSAEIISCVASLERRAQRVKDESCSRPRGEQALSHGRIVKWCTDRYKCLDSDTVA